MIKKIHVGELNQKTIQIEDYNDRIIIMILRGDKIDNRFMFTANEAANLANDIKEVADYLRNKT